MINNTFYEDFKQVYKFLDGKNPYYEGKSKNWSRFWNVNDGTRSIQLDDFPSIEIDLESNKYQLREKLLNQDY